MVGIAQLLFGVALMAIGTVGIFFGIASLISWLR